VNILVTGAQGLLGRSVVALAKENHDVVGVDIDEMDVTDKKAVMTTIGDSSPEVVLHCAAFTQVDKAETDESVAMEVNAFGAERVAGAASKVGAQMVYVSTDYVFDGTKNVPYLEEDTPRPLSRYGFSKLEGERRVLAACPENHLIVRTAWLYGSGAGFPDWVCQKLEAEEPIKLVTDHRGSPTYASDLAGALLRLVEQGHCGVFHFVNKGETTWFGFGQAVAESTGRSEASFSSVASVELARPAVRPAYSVLAVGKYESATGAEVASWRDALERYLTSTGRSV
jgi:dTDP-4-dehydrorhamnose reductase